MNDFLDTSIVEDLFKMAKSLGKKAKETLDAIIKTVSYDVEAVKQRDPAAKSGMEIVFLYSGMHALLAYRVSHKLYVTKHYFSARLISQIARFFNGRAARDADVLAHLTGDNARQRGFAKAIGLRNHGNPIPKG